MFRYGTLIVVGLVMSLGASEASAQRRVPNFSRRPPISPYVNLFNNQNGGVNNYFQFVRPLQQQARFNQQQINQTTQLQRQLNQPQGNMQMNTMGVMPQNGMLRAGNQGIGMPSQAATFFNYSHFYAPTRAVGGGGRRTAGF